MKVFLVSLLILVSAIGFSQPTTGYTNINARYNWLGGYFRALHVPAYGTTPSLQTGQWTGSGAVGVDSVLHRMFFYTNGTWRRLMNYSDAVDSIWRTAGVDSIYWRRGGTTFAIKDSTGGGSTPTLQQVLDAGSTLSSSETIDLGADNTLLLNGTSAGDAWSSQLGIGGVGLKAISINNVGLWGISTNYAGVTGESSSTTGSGALQGFLNNATTNANHALLTLYRRTSGTAANGIAGSIDMYTETTTGADALSLRISSKLTNATNASRTSEVDIFGLDNSATDTFMNIQKDLVRINNNADTLATQAYARSVGGGGGGLTVGTTTITSGTDTRVLYNNAGVLGEYTTTGSGTTIAKSTSPVFTTDITATKIYGGSATTSDLDFVTTSGNADATAIMSFKTGNNGSVTAMQIGNGGDITFGSTMTYLGATSGSLRVNAGATSLAGYELRGTNNPAFNTYNGSTQVGWAPAVVTSNGAFMTSSLAGDMAFVAASGYRIIMGSPNGSTPKLIIDGTNTSFYAETQHELQLKVKDISAPSTPASGYGALYVNTDTLRFKNDAGAVFSYTHTSSGTYTPTLTNGANVNTSTATACQWLRVGNTVTISGMIEIDATAGSATLTQLEFSLPFASAFTQSYHAGGVGQDGNGTNTNAIATIYADATDDRLVLEYLSSLTDPVKIYFTVTYQIL